MKLGISCPFVLKSLSNKNILRSVIKMPKLKYVLIVCILKRQVKIDSSLYRLKLLGKVLNSDANAKIY